MSNRNSTSTNPPSWMDRFVSRLCPDHLLEEVMGDLHERYEFAIHKYGRKRANRRYLLETLYYIRVTAFRRQNSTNTTPNYITMVKHYLIIAFRNISRNKAFSAINISGLALGLSAFLLILLWVSDERKVNNFHKNQRQLYSLYLKLGNDGQVSANRLIKEWEFFEGFGENWLSEELKRDIPEIEYVASYITSYDLPWGHTTTFQLADHKYKFKGGAAGEDFFKMFSYPVLFGDGHGALEGLNSIAISKQMASFFFETPADAIGQTLRYENYLDVDIKAVFDDIASNSTMQFDYLLSWKNGKDNQNFLSSDNKWPTFIQLKQNADPTLVAEKLRNYGQYNNPAYDIVELDMQPLADQYLVSNFENGEPNGGRIAYVKIFTGAAIFILIIACINFTNLSTARALKRAKEVGVKKVVGSSRGLLIGQFLTESVLLSLIALIISLFLVNLALPIFNNFTGKQMQLPLDELSYLMFLIGITLVTSLLAGAYSALYLSSLKPVRVLKGLVRFSKSAAFFRKGLSVFQFSLSILLLIATFVVSKQTSFIQNTNLGYNKENIVYVRIEGGLNRYYSGFKAKLESLPGIALVDRSSEAPHNMGFEMSSPFKWQGQEDGQAVSFKPTSVGFDFIEMMNLEVVEGRSFSRDYATDTAAFMINETALKQMQMEDPLGKWISAWNKRGQIVGILKDYHTHSLHETIKPLIVDVKENLNFGIIMIKTMPGQTAQALASLEEANNKFNADYPLEYQFLDQEYANLYRSEQVVSSLSNVFAGLAILISCLGLLGLAMFSAEQRIKEIGIRKVLGASVQSIIALFSKDFLQLVGLSFVIATPIAAYLMKNWLQGFAYQIQLSWWIFALTGLMALLIAFLTVAYQTFKAARSNPVKNLRME